MGSVRGLKGCVGLRAQFSWKTRHRHLEDTEMKDRVGSALLASGPR